MLNSEEFYGLVPGAIGVLMYTGCTTKPSEELVANIQQEMASSMFSAYLSNYAMLKGSGQDVDPQTAFENARKRALEEAEKLASTPTVQEFHVQIGQEESIKKMLELEQSDQFVAWQDPNMANLIKSTI